MDTMIIKGKEIPIDGLESMIIEGHIVEAKRILEKTLKRITNRYVETASNIILYTKKNSRFPSSEYVQSTIEEKEKTYRLKRSAQFDEQQKYKTIQKSKLKNDEIAHVPKCPTCGATNIERIGFGTKAAAAVMFGVASSTARGQYICKNCGYKW